MTTAIAKLEAALEQFQRLTIGSIKPEDRPATDAAFRQVVGTMLERTIPEGAPCEPEFRRFKPMMRLGIRE